MKIALGADHKGYAYKELVKAMLFHRGFEINDHGSFSEVSTDYPEYAQAVAEEVNAKIADFGILICWTGNGMAIAANKFKGIRAGIGVQSGDG